VLLLDHIDAAKITSDHIIEAVPLLCPLVAQLTLLSVFWRREEHVLDFSVHFCTEFLWQE
jgi:hypothetical protein